MNLNLESFIDELECISPNTCSKCSYFIVSASVSQTLTNTNTVIRCHKIQDKRGACKYVITLTLKFSPARQVSVWQLWHVRMCWKVEAERQRNLPKDTADMWREQVLWILKPLCPSPGDRKCLRPVLKTATVPGFHPVQQAPRPGLHIHLPI